MKNAGFLILLLACACQSFRDQPISETPPPPDVVLHLVDPAMFSVVPLKSPDAVRAFYVNRKFALSWHEEGRRVAAADSLIALIDAVDTLGLIPEDYHADAIRRSLSDTVSLDRLLKTDLLLSDAYLTIYRHLRHGRLDPATLQKKEVSDIPFESAIRSLENLPDLSLQKELRQAEPASPQYHVLKKALKALVTSADSAQSARALQLALNMERWRWQDQWPDRYVVVNIPSFMLQVVEDDSVFLESRVIVGKRQTPTPILESVIRSFIIYPYWHAPHSIATTELLPELQRDSSYLRRNNFEVLNKRGVVISPDTIRWKRYSKGFFPFVLRQREGSENSMGIIKFNFANNYGVYLHDTNSKRLFARRDRDLSHGCVRVNKAVALAHYLVREDDIYVSPDDLDQYLSLQQRLKIDLRKPIVLKLEYFTAVVRNGEPVFYEDIYKKDSLMVRSLYPSGDTAIHAATPDIPGSL